MVYFINYYALSSEQCSISDTGVLLPKFRWHRSRWGRFCPVELANGNMVPGRMEFSVGYAHF